MINKTILSNALIIGTFVSLFFACTKKEDKVEPVVSEPGVIKTEAVIPLDIEVNKILNHKAYEANLDKSIFLLKYDNLKLISMDSVIDNSIIDKLVNKNIYLYGEFVNISKNRASISDTVFVWERLSINKPLGWDIGFCIGGVCNPPTTLKGEFFLGKKSLEVFDFIISALDHKGYAANFGVGVLTAEFLIYRKGMKREDGAKFSVQVTGK